MWTMMRLDIQFLVCEPSMINWLVSTSTRTGYQLVRAFTYLLNLLS